MPISMYFPSGPKFKLEPHPKREPRPPPPELVLPSEELDTEFKREYPPDVSGREVDDTARVWKVYRAHAIAHDDTLLEGWNATLDILLIFAGLFSAVVTAFLIESYQSLQFDHDSFISAALYALLAASADHTSLRDVPRPPPFAESPSRATRFVNGLWFISLLLALSVSLLSILIKQWIREYKARNHAPTRSPRHWSLRRTFLHQALMGWPVGGLISVLPVILHVALFLFLAGSVIFLWDLDRGIALVFTTVSGILGAVYLASIGIPLWRPEFPTSTPVVDLIRYTYVSLGINLVRARFAFWSSLVRLGWHVYSYSFVRQLLTACGSFQARIRLWNGSGWMTRLRRGILRRDEERATVDATPRSGRERAVGPLPLDDQIVRLAQRMSNTAMIHQYCLLHDSYITAAALKWLILSTSDSDAVAVGLQALGALSSASLKNLRGDADIKDLASSGAFFTRGLAGPGPKELARVVRAMHALNSTDTVSTMGLLSRSIYSDFAVLSRGGQLNYGEGSSSTLTNTALVVLQGSSSKNAISVLQYCVLEDVGDAGWDCISRFLDRCYGPDQDRAPSLDPWTGPMVSLYALFCLTGELQPLWGSADRTPDLTAHVVLGEHEAELHRTILHLLPYLLKHFRTDDTTWKWGYKPRRALLKCVRQTDVEHLVDVLSSSSFLGHNHQTETTSNAVHVLRSIIIADIRSRKYHRAHLAAFAWASIVQKFGSSGNFRFHVYDFICEALETEMLSSERTAILALVLQPAFRGSKTTVWKVLSRSSATDLEKRICIATRLSIELCCLNDDDNVDNVVWQFVDHLPYGILREALVLSRSYRHTVTLLRNYRTLSQVFSGILWSQRWTALLKRITPKPNDRALYRSAFARLLRDIDDDGFHLVTWDDIANQVARLPPSITPASPLDLSPASSDDSEDE